MNKKLLFATLFATTLICLTMIYGKSKEHNGNYILFNESAAAKHVIKSSVAKTYMDAFAQEREILSRKLNTNEFNIPLYETFNRDAFAALLNVPGMKGIRCTYGKKPDGQIVAMFVPVDVNGEEIKAKLLTKDDKYKVNQNDADGDVIDQGMLCPPTCPPKDF
jgi:hypothetical protein